MRLNLLPGHAVAAASGKGQSTPPERPEKPQRVQPNLNVSVKKQIAWGRIARSLNEPDSEPKETTKTRFRRRKGSEDDVAEEVRREREEAAAKSSKLPSLRNLYNTKGWPNPPVVLVDGYNVLMQWVQRANECDGADTLPSLGMQVSATVNLRNISLDTPIFGRLRDRLLAELSQYSVWRDVKVLVAFDARGNTAHVETQRQMYIGIEVVWAVETDADQFIIAEARHLRKLGAPKVLVASNDREIKASCFGDEIFPLGSVTLLKDMRKTTNESNHMGLQATSRAKPNLGESIYTPSSKVFSTLKYRPPRRW